MKSRRIFQLGAMCLGIALIFVSVCVFYSFHTRREAEKCLESIRLLHVGSTSREEAERAMQPFTGIQPSVSSYSERNGVTYPITFLRFENSGLHLLGIFHPASLYVTLVYREGILAEKDTAYEQEEPKITVVTIESLQGFRPDSPLNRNSPAHASIVEESQANMSVFLKPDASDGFHRLLYAYNLGCFTASAGCQKAEEVLPGIKQLPRE